jgi:hypothetical protein
MDDAPFSLNQSFTAPRAEVWKAITDPAQMRQWYFEEMPGFKPEVITETKIAYRLFLKRTELKPTSTRLPAIAAERGKTHPQPHPIDIKYWDQYPRRSAK